MDVLLVISAKIGYNQNKIGHEIRFVEGIVSSINLGGFLQEISVQSITQYHTIISHSSDSSIKYFMLAVMRGMGTVHQEMQSTTTTPGGATYKVKVHKKSEPYNLLQLTND